MLVMGNAVADNWAGSLNQLGQDQLALSQLGPLSKRAHP